MNKRFGSFYAAHHGLALAFLLPYTVLFGSNPDIIEARALAIWSLENLLTDILSLYRYTYGPPVWWDSARLPMILSLLVPAAAGLGYGIANINELVIGTFHPATVLLTAAGVLMPLFSLHHQVKAWRDRNIRVRQQQAGGDQRHVHERLPQHCPSSDVSCQGKLSGGTEVGVQSKQCSGDNRVSGSDQNQPLDVPAGEWLVRVHSEH